MKIKTIDVQAKEWFDRINGNSYFSALVTINFGMKAEKRIEMPFQYGYGNHYEHMAFQELTKNSYVKDAETQEVFWRYYRRKGIIYRHSKQEGCKKRDLIHN